MLKSFPATRDCSRHEGVENDGATGGKELASYFSAAQLSGFATLSKGRLQIT